jgi:hypothetical protein
MKDSFNADFYATAATVIPVLYLALAVQGSTLDAIAMWAGRRIWGTPGEANKVRVRLAFQGGSILAGIIFGGGVLGELTAFNALYNQRADSYDAQLVLSSLIWLALTVGVVSVWRSGKILRDADLASRQKRDKP